MSALCWRREVCVLVWGTMLASCAATSCLVAGQTSESDPPSALAQNGSFTLIGDISQNQTAAGSQDVPSPTSSQETSVVPPNHPWHYGAFFDLGYLRDFNDPSNHLFRNRSTTPRVNELDLNMAGIFFSKDASANSRWGTELLVQAGEDSKIFGFSRICMGPRRALDRLSANDKSRDQHRRVPRADAALTGLWADLDTRIAITADSAVTSSCPNPHTFSESSAQSKIPM